MLLDLIRGKSGEQISLGWLYVHSMEHNCITYCKWGRGESNTQHITTPRIVFLTYCSLLYMFFRIDILSLFQRILCQTFCFAWLDPKVKQMHLFSNDFRMRQYFMQNISFKINADALFNHFQKLKRNNNRQPYQYLKYEKDINQSINQYINQSCICYLIICICICFCI